MDSIKEKKSPPWDRGLVLDGAGKTVDVFPPALSAHLGDAGVSLFSMLTDSDAARLSEFCAVVPAPSRDPAAFASNVAVFPLSDRRFDTAVAVKDRVFSGSHTVVYLLEGKGAAVRFPDFIINELPERIRPVISVLNGQPADVPPGFPLSELAAGLRRRVGIDGTESLSLLVRSVIRRLSFYPELCCGTVRADGPAEPGPLCVSVSAGAFCAIFSLLVSALNSSSERHETLVRIAPRCGAAEITLEVPDPGALADVFSDSRDLPGLAARLPRCLEKLSLAAYLSAATGIAVGVTADGRAGFSMTLFPDPGREEFKDLYPSFDPDLVLGELAQLSRVSEEERAGE